MNLESAIKRVARYRTDIVTHGATRVAMDTVVEAARAHAATQETSPEIPVVTLADVPELSLLPRQINEAVERVFAEFLAEHGLLDFREEPPGPERTALKAKTLRLMYGADE